MRPNYLFACFLLLSFGGCLNPFAPGFDEGTGTPGSILGDQSTVEGLFQNFKFAYTFKDTTVYGQLLGGNFAFVYRDYDRGVDVSWGRDEEMRATYGLFLNAQNLDLIWNNIISFSGDSLNASIVRNFNLTVTFNPSDIIRVDGYVNMALERPKLDSNWLITRWRDESNF